METIVIATDFSSAADNAVNYGADLAKHFSSKIVIVNAFSMPLAGYDSLAPVMVLAEIQNQTIRSLDEIKARIILRIGYDPGVYCVAEAGSPCDVLNEAINTYSGEVVVMGMTGEAGPVKKHIIGSTAIDATRNIEVPIFIIPQDISYHPVHRISFACDFEKVEESTLLYSARSFASVFNAELEIVNVAPKNRTPLEKVSANTFIDRTLGGVTHKTTILESDDPAEVLAEYFKFNPSDLLILNPKKHNIFKRIFIKSVSAQLIFEVKLPVLIIH